MRTLYRARTKQEFARLPRCEQDAIEQSDMDTGYGVVPDEAATRDAQTWRQLRSDIEGFMLRPVKRLRTLVRRYDKNGQLTGIGFCEARDVLNALANAFEGEEAE